MERPADPPRAAASTRATPRLLVILAAVFLAGRLVLAFVEKKPEVVGQEPRAAGSDLVHWVAPDSAENLASQMGKPILYDFAADWCGPCKIMQREVFSDTAAAAWINETFVPSRVIDRTAEEGHNLPKVAALQRKYKIKSFPTLVVVAQPDSEATILPGYGGKARTLEDLRAAAGR